MKTIKLLFFLALFVVSFTINAQEKITVTDNKIQEKVVQSQDSQKQLSLTYEQQTPYREIIKRYAELARAVRKSILKPEEKKEKFKVLDLQREAEIKALLTSEQYKIHTELQEFRKSRMVDMKKKDAPGSVNAK
jgi:hypothetical protein